MAEITPTPRAGTWHEITPNPQWEAQPRAGTWHEIDPLQMRRPAHHLGFVRGRRG